MQTPLEIFHQCIRLAKRALDQKKHTGSQSASQLPTPILDVVADLLGRGTTTVIDVGARWAEVPSWWRLSPLANLVGFEADPEECARLNALCGSKRTETFVPLALGAEAKAATLYLTKQSACASLYPPLEKLADRYPSLEDIRCVGTQPVMLSPLDAWWEKEERPHVSFLKIDTQGSELDILKGAVGVLRGALGCEVEVEFNPLYQGQPLFSDVDAFLRAEGFSLWQLKDPCSYSETKGNVGLRGKLHWANAVYFRDFHEMEANEGQWDRFLILAALLEAAGDSTSARSCLNRAFQSLQSPAQVFPMAPWQLRGAVS
jgi:FkbM family methyltransferase